METVTILIGNSDNKLTQVEWSEFYAHVDDAVGTHAQSVQFSAPSNGAAPWQNACWVAILSGRESSQRLSERLAVLASNYRQDSIAVVTGVSRFVEASARGGK